MKNLAVRVFNGSDTPLEFPGADTQRRSYFPVTISAWRGN